MALSVERKARRAITGWRLLAVIVIALALRAGLVAAGVVPFNADEAVVGLMARHILNGARPVFFYGQAYLGSLDAWLVAGAFALFGSSVSAMRAVQLLLYCGTLVTTYWLGLKIYRSQWIAGAAALFLALPPVLFTVYSTVTLGGYGETLLIGNLLLLLGLTLTVPVQRRTAGWIAWGGWLLLGLLGGLGFWTFPLIAVYLLPVAGLVVAQGRRQPRQLLRPGGLFALGFVLGAAPWLGYSVAHGWVTLAETGGAAIAGASASQPVFAAFEHLGLFLLFGLTVIWGLRPPWNAEFLALPLVPFALALHFGTLLFAVRRTVRARDAAGPGRRLLMGIGVIVLLGFVFTPFGADPSGRYFLPLGVAAGLFVAELLHWLRLRRRQRRTPWRKWFGQMLALGLIAFNWIGNVQSAVRFPPGLTTQFDSATQIDQRSLPGLMRFLRDHGETRGYTNYWVEYPLAFLSQEDLIYVARLPYHADFRYTPRDDRYAPYDQSVADSPRVAYITTLHPALDQRLRTGLSELGVSYDETDIGDFHVFYGLSRKVTPGELGLGEECCPE